GSGLAGLRERVEVAGGSFEAGPTLRGGFLVLAWLPWAESAAEAEAEEAEEDTAESSVEAVSVADLVRAGHGTGSAALGSLPGPAFIASAPEPDDDMTGVARVPAGAPAATAA
ncbi:MAG: hypothetical protein HOV83_17460, partial [Catenulispora sp.]|nr:hypothetical protein [Catenulispora sp.]